MSIINKTERISLQLLDQNQILVPHMKDLFHNCLETKGQGFLGV